MTDTHFILITNALSQIIPDTLADLLLNINTFYSRWPTRTRMTKTRPPSLESPHPFINYRFVPHPFQIIDNKSSIIRRPMAWTVERTSLNIPRTNKTNQDSLLPHVSQFIIYNHPASRQQILHVTQWASLNKLQSLQRVTNVFEINHDMQQNIKFTWIILSLNEWVTLKFVKFCTRKGNELNLLHNSRMNTMETICQIIMNIHMFIP